MKIKYPSWCYKSIDFAKLTQDEVENYRIETNKVIEDNKLIIIENNNKFNILLDYAKELWGNNNLVIKYLIKNKPAQLSAPFDFKISIEEKWQKHKDKINKENADKIAAEKLINLKAEAVLYLQNHGKVKDKDFTLENCIEMADNIAFEIEKERLIKLDINHSFNGQNCDDCSGWDGISRRCNCGNRRVSWEVMDYHSFLNPSVHGEAY